MLENDSDPRNAAHSCEFHFHMFRETHKRLSQDDAQTNSSFYYIITFPKSKFATCK